MYTLIILVATFTASGGRVVASVPGFETWDLCATAATQVAKTDKDEIAALCVRVKK